MADTKDAASKDEFKFEDAPVIDSLPVRHKTRKPNPLQARVEQALKDQKADPRPANKGYFVGRGVLVKGDDAVTKASRWIHQAALALNASAKITTVKNADGTTAVQFAVNPVRRSRS